MIRSEEMIDKQLKRLANLWKKHPDMGLANLIGKLFDFQNVVVHCLEDNEFLDALEQYYSRMDKKNK